MALNVVKKAIEEGKMRCPECKGSVKQFDKFVETCDSVWDGAGDSGLETKGAKVTLICGNGNCQWRERTEYWSEYIED